MRFNTKQYLVLFLVVVSGLLRAENQTIREQLRSADLSQKFPQTTLQPVERLDPSTLQVFVNANLAGIPANIPGWNSDDPSKSDMAKLMELFGVRTTDQKPPYAPGTELFFFSKGVGRSGILEKDQPGDYFLKHNGVSYKGLTIKGYGGNLGNFRGLQPDGTLNVTEAVRDTILSSIMLENGIDSYVGLLHVDRPKSQSNFIRLSRTVFRMNDLTDRKGQELRTVVDYMTTLLQDEVGKKMDANEFYDWLVNKSAKVIAGKNYVRFRHGSITGADNFGIGEMVDFGEGEYWGDKPVTNQYANPDQKREFKEHLRRAAANIAQEFGLTKDFETAFEPTYENHLSELKAKDAARVNLATADSASLKNIGLSDLTTQALLQAQKSKAFGILTREEAMDLPGISPQEKEIIWHKTRTPFITMDENRVLPSAILQTLGGASGVREALSKLALAADSNQISLKDTAAVETFMKNEINSILNGRGTVVGAFSGYNEYSPLTHLARNSKKFVEYSQTTDPTLMNPNRSSLTSGSGCTSTMKAVASVQP